jgi:hypothetical protein
LLASVADFIYLLNSLNLLTLKSLNVVKDLIAMPTANVYSSDTASQDSLVKLGTSLRELLARELTCGDITLDPNEISIRFLSVTTNASMIAPVEIEIMAHAFGDRTKRADTICLIVRDFVKEKIPSIKDVRVWLVLAELGHSWQD